MIFNKVAYSVSEESDLFESPVFKSPVVLLALNRLATQTIVLAVIASPDFLSR